MAQIYFKLVVMGTKTIEDVPERLREEVKALLEKNGYSVD